MMVTANNGHKETRQPTYAELRKVWNLLLEYERSPNQKNDSLYSALRLVRGMAMANILENDMSQFKREERYYVIKLTDIDGVLDADERQHLAHLTDKIEHNRSVKGKIPLQCVCIESDWPIYEPAWDMVQRFAEGQELTPRKLTDEVFNKLHKKNTMDQWLDIRGLADDVADFVCGKDL